MLKHWVRVEQGCDFPVDQQKMFGIFFEKCTQDIVFIQSYINFQDVNLDGKLRKKPHKNHAFRLSTAV